MRKAVSLAIVTAAAGGLAAGAAPARAGVSVGGDWFGSSSTPISPATTNAPAGQATPAAQPAGSPVDSVMGLVGGLL